jgi:hypothetical protein
VIAVIEAPPQRPKKQQSATLAKKRATTPLSPFLPFGAPLASSTSSQTCLVRTHTHAKKVRMLRQKQFVKKTKSGKVLKVVKEHYLRDDIWCSVETCKVCEHSDPILSATPSVNRLFPHPHYIIPDTNIFMNQVGLRSVELCKKKSK